MTIDPKILSKTVKAIAPKEDIATETQVRGTVVISQGGKYVHLDGAAEGVLTPVVDALGDGDSHGFTHGDRVLVLLKDHQALVTKNISDGLQTKTAIAAGEKADDAWTKAFVAEKAAGEAWAYARDAETAATAANGILDDMQNAALDAGTTLTQIYQDAIEANASAYMATNAASSAQASLGDIEKVIGAIEWIAKHGDIQPTNDTEPIPGKFYFDSNKIQVTPVVNPSEQEYYELLIEQWNISSDEEADPAKNYFMQYGSGTIIEPYYYEVVDINRDINPSNEEWYEFTGGAYVLTDDTSILENKLYFDQIPSYYDLTEDTVIFIGKTYYTRSDTEPYIYTPVTPTTGEENPSEEGWYELYVDVYELITSYSANPLKEGWFELSDDTYQLTDDVRVIEHKLYFYLNPPYYELTEDTVIFIGKTYYTRSDTEPYTYTIVEPTTGEENPSEEGWYEYIVDYDYKVVTNYIPNPYLLGLYELDSIDASISRYVASHVSLDDFGLVIQTDKDTRGNEIKSKVRIGGSGVELINDNGDTIAVFSEEIMLGDRTGIHVTLSPGVPESIDPPIPAKLPELGFWKDASTEVAYINSETLMITKSQITNSLRIGDYIWQVQSNRISLIYAP